jgi:LacI family fructose operon transcriptional repressor
MAVGQLLAQSGRPEALIASNGVMLLDMVRAIRRSGLRMPQDIGLAGFDNEPWTEIVGDGITVIEQPVEDIGRNAVAILLDRSAHPDGAAKRLALQARCVVRGSTVGPPSPA